MKTIFIKGKVFGEGCGDRGQNVAFVEADGSVTVQDWVQGGRTSCHSLSDLQMEIIRQSADHSTVDLAQAMELFISDEAFMNDYDASPERLA